MGQCPKKDFCHDKVKKKLEITRASLFNIYVQRLFPTALTGKKIRRRMEKEKEKKKEGNKIHRYPLQFFSNIPFSLSHYTIFSHSHFLPCKSLPTKRQKPI